MVGSRLDIKPLSVNKAWGGRTFKSNDYKKYEKDIAAMIEPIEIPEGYLEITMIFGFSSKSSDFDNPIKPFVDCLQRGYGFNDKLIKRAIIEVEHVKKGEEFVEFDFKPYKEKVKQYE